MPYTKRLAFAEFCDDRIEKRREQWTRQWLTKLWHRMQKWGKCRKDHLRKYAVNETERTTEELYRKTKFGINQYGTKRQTKPRGSTRNNTRNRSVCCDKNKPNVKATCLVLYEGTQKNNNSRLNQHRTGPERLRKDWQKKKQKSDCQWQTRQQQIIRKIRIEYSTNNYKQDTNQHSTRG